MTADMKSDSELDTYSMPIKKEVEGEVWRVNLERRRERVSGLTSGYRRSHARTLYSHVPTHLTTAASIFSDAAMRCQVQNPTTG